MQNDSRSSHLTQINVKKPFLTAKRMAAIQEAISWPSGPDINNKRRTIIYDGDGYTVCLAKPGKEAAPDYKGAKFKDGISGRNVNDMRPEILVNGDLIERNLSFADIFEQIQTLHTQSAEASYVLGCLLVRMAYMADHEKVDSGIYRYIPHDGLLTRLRRATEYIGGIPVEAYLYFLEALALNEDVKYSTLGYDISNGTGRKNNLLTCAHIIAVLHGRVSIAKFAGSFARPPVGIAPISLSGACGMFPDIAPEEDPMLSL